MVAKALRDKFEDWQWECEDCKHVWRSERYECPKCKSINTVRKLDEK